MRRNVARRPRHIGWSQISSALLSALVLVGAISLSAPPRVLAGTAMAAACDGVRLRTGPSTSDTTAATVSFGALVSVETTVTGGAWSATCAGNAVTGDGWHQISELYGQSVTTLFGVPYVYGAIGLFQAVATP